MKQCSWCNTQFVANVSYQVYCSSNCREQATKEKIADRHKAIKRQKRNEKLRMCAGKCGTRLSAYNDHTLCNNCYINTKEVNRKIREIRMFMHDYEDDTK